VLSDDVNVKPVKPMIREEGEKGVLFQSPEGKDFPLPSENITNRDKKSETNAKKKKNCFEKYEI